jgi:hypothetical protein
VLDERPVRYEHAQEFPPAADVYGMSVNAR